MKKHLLFLSILLVLAGSFFTTGAAQAQDEFTLGLNRDFGYGGIGEIQGMFTMKINQGPENLVRVVFLIDGKPVAEDAEAPFKFQFNTDSYPAGAHQLSALGYSSAGDELKSNVISTKFIAAADVPGKTMKAILPILIVIVCALLVSFLVPLLFTRKGSSLPAGVARNYSFFGGTICPKCNRPFALHMFKLNLVVGALDRCPHCGKWSLVRSVGINQLREAEAAELLEAQQQAGQATGLSQEEKLRKELDDSKYLNT